MVSESGHFPNRSYVDQDGCHHQYGSTFYFDGATATNNVVLTDNLADALNIKEGSNSYIKIVTTNSAEMIVLGQNVTVTDAKNVVLGTTTGTKLGTAVSQKLGLFGVTPVVQPAGAAQKIVAVDAATNTTPYGFATAAQADDMVATINAIRQALIDLGVIRGAA